MTKRFYKDDQGWFIDLPELVQDGTFSKSNLAMVLGADTLLDKLSKNGSEITIRFENKKFEGWEEHLRNTSVGMDQEALEDLNHPIELGGYYHAEKHDHPLWLCSVCSFLFGGEFPKNIYIKTII
jgi:hypothetical protein